LDEIKRSIYSNLRQTSFAFNPANYNKYGIYTYDRPGESKYLGQIQIAIPINSTDSQVPNFTFDVKFDGSRIVSPIYSEE
jgi:hypothetical protein